MGKKLIVIDQKGSGDYLSIQEALDAVPERNQGMMLLVKEGIYREKLMIAKPNITLVGEPGADICVVYDDFAKLIEVDGLQFRTFSTASVTVIADDFSAENIIFMNQATEEGQTIAVYVDGDRVQFHHCGFIGYQDTVFTAPLPSSPMRNIELPAVYRRERKVGRHYYRGCYFEGSVDFILGSATAVFEYCKIHSTKSANADVGYITAASTPRGSEFGYVFLSCILSGDAPNGSVYLGRPWREHAKVAFIDCLMDQHINPKGWHDWNQGSTTHQTTDFVEYNSRGVGAHTDSRVEWSRILSTEEAQQYTLENIFKDARWCIGDCHPTSGLITHRS